MDDMNDAEYYADALYEERMCEQYDGHCEICPCRYECEGAWWDSENK